MVRLRPFLFSLLVVFPLLAFGVVTERPVSDPRVGVAATSAARSMFGASNGERFLVVWASVGRGGQALLLDAAGQPVGATSVGLPFTPRAVFWREDVWYVVGESPMSGRGWVRVDANGLLLDREPHPLMLTTGTLEGAVWAGESLIAIIRNYDATTQQSTAMAVVLDAHLQPKATHVIGKWPVELLLEADGETALVAFYENVAKPRPLNALLFSRTGELMRQRTLPAVTTAVAAGTRGGGTGYFLITKADVQNEHAYFGGFHLDHQLNMQLGPTAFGRDAHLHAYSRTASWDGSAYTFFYLTDGPTVGEIRAARLNGEGKAIEDAVVRTVDPFFDWQAGLAGVSGMGTTLFLHHDTLEPNGSERLLRMRAGRDVASLAASQECDLERGAFQQVEPVVASSATQALIAWEELVVVGQPRWVYATRVDAGGRIRDPQSIFLGTTQSGLSVASDGDDFVMAWHETMGVRTAHVRADGTVGVKTLIPRAGGSAQTPGEVLVLSNGTDYLLVWTQESASRTLVYGIRLRADGTAIDSAPFDVGTAFGVIQGASDGRDYLLAWDGKAVVVSANGFITAHLTLGGFGTTAVWWNGTAYGTLQVDLAGHRPMRVSPSGAVTVAAAPFPWPVARPSWGWTVGPACDRWGCSLIYGTFEQGRTFLREIRATDDGAVVGLARGLGVEVAPILLRHDSEGMSIVPFRVAGGRLFAAFTRYALEAPYAGNARIFIAPLQSSRMRAVRH